MHTLPPRHRRITVHPKPLPHQLSSFWRAASSKPDWTLSPLYSFRPANSHFVSSSWLEFTSLLTSRPSFLHDAFTPKPLIPGGSDSEITASVVHFMSNAVISNLKPIMWQMQPRENLTHQRHIQVGWRESLSFFSPKPSSSVLCSGKSPGSVRLSDVIPQIKTTSCLVEKVLTDD